MSKDDFYSVLGVAPAATLDQIKERFRFLSHAYHPDKFTTDTHRRTAEEEFKRINHAYQVLSDPAKRSQFDKSRSDYADPKPRKDPANTSKPSAEPPEREVPRQRPERKRNNQFAVIALLAALTCIVWIAVANRQNSRSANSGDSLGQYQHVFNANGYCTRCGWERDYIARTDRPCVSSQTPTTTERSEPTQDHRFNANGFCSRCGWEKDYLSRTRRPCIQ